MSSPGSVAVKSSVTRGATVALSAGVLLSLGLAAAALALAVRTAGQTRACPGPPSRPTSLLADGTPNLHHIPAVGRLRIRRDGIGAF